MWDASQQSSPHIPTHTKHRSQAIAELATEYVARNLMTDFASSVTRKNWFGLSTCVLKSGGSCGVSRCVR